MINSNQPSAWDIVSRLYGDQKNINEKQFQEKFGRYFDEYDPTREEYAKKGYSQQVTGLLSNFGKSLSQINSQQTFASGGIEKMQNFLYKDTLGRLNNARTQFKETVFGFKDQYEQGLIDMAGSLADQIAGFDWGSQKTIAGRLDPTTLKKKYPNPNTATEDFNGDGNRDRIYGDY